MTKTIEKDIRKEEYKLKISSNRVKIVPTNTNAYRKLTKLLKTPNANFHTYQLKQERLFRVVLRNIHHSADLFFFFFFFFYVEEIRKDTRPLLEEGGGVAAW